VSAGTTGTIATAERPAVPVPREGWVQVANAFIDAAPLDNERLAHIILMSYAWDDESCHPYQEELAARLGVSVRTIKRRIGELRAAALVTVERGGGQDHPNVYHLHVRPVRDDDDVRFATILHRVLDDATLSQGARRAYIVLCRRAGGHGWCPCSHKTLGERIGARPRAVYTYVRELEEAGYLRITAREGRSNRYSVETPERRKRAAGHSTTPPLAVAPLPTSAADVATDARWRALYRELMRAEPTGQVVRGVRTLLADVGEATVLDAIRGGAEWCARAHRQTLTIGAIRTEVGKIRGAEGLPPLEARPGASEVEAVEIALPPADMEPAWRDALNELRGEMTAENYKRWLEPTVVLGREGDLLRVGVGDAFDARWLDRRLRAMIERALARVAPGVRVTFEVREAPLATDATDAEEVRAPQLAVLPPPTLPRASPREAPAPATHVTIERCARCHHAPCCCPRKDRRVRARRSKKGT